MVRKFFFVLLSVLVLPVVSQAAKFTPVFVSGLEFGGDELVNVYYSDGSKSNIEAGRGILLGGGAVFPINEKFEAQTTLALKWTSVKQARNGDVTWTRFPIEVLGFYKNAEKRFRAGGGLTYQVANEIKGTQDASAVSAKFDNAAGLVLAADYFSAGLNMSFGARYTAIQYKAQVSGASEVRGNSFGVSFNYYWL